MQEDFRMDESEIVKEVRDQLYDSDIIRVEVECEGSPEPRAVEVRDSEDLVEELRKALKLDPDVLLFERDKGEPLTGPVRGRKALRLVAHKSKQITVQVRYEHRTEQEIFPPSKTVFKVLQWAVSKKGFNLDPASAAKANLMLPGADTPLPRDGVIGSYTQPGQCVLILDLTLRDFTNG
jgi:hypothetical protein